MAIVIKSIKPARFKDQAFRQAIEAELKKVGQEMKADFEKTTATWEHKPEFEIITDVSPPTVLVATDDEIYGYVSKGTKPHAIFAGIYTGKSDKKALAFPVRSAPKTRPGMIRSMPGFKSKAKVVRPYVMHPGTKPRNFEEAIKKLWTKKFRTRMERAMSLALRKSGLAL